MDKDKLHSTLDVQFKELSLKYTSNVTELADFKTHVSQSTSNNFNPPTIISKSSVNNETKNGWT